MGVNGNIHKPRCRKRQTKNEWAKGDSCNDFPEENRGPAGEQRSDRLLGDESDRGKGLFSWFVAIAVHHQF